MTTFEIIVAVAIIAIVMLLTAIGTFVKGVWENQKSQEKKLDFINKQIAGIWRGQDKIENNAAILSSIVDKMHKNLCVEIADKMVNRIYPDKESMNKIDWDKLSKEQQDEFLKRLIMPNYDSPLQPIYTPCYAPNGICTNPQMDCINCPKRGTGGTWSTSTNMSKNDE